MDEIIMIVMEIVGTVAFSISGALIAISCSLDVFGVTFIGVITAVGGGMLRDMDDRNLSSDNFFKYIYVRYCSCNGNNCFYNRIY